MFAICKLNGAGYCYLFSITSRKRAARISQLPGYLVIEARVLALTA